MLLTLKPSTQTGTKGPHEYSIVRQSIPARRSSWTPAAAGSVHTSPASQPSRARKMDPNPRRELPPPVGMTMPPEPQATAIVSSSQLPPLPSQYHTEDSFRQWLRTKAEEDRRRQEEERTRQETLRLEQRRIEQNMLRDAVQAGVPPQMVPYIFVGISGGNLSRSSLDLAPPIDLSQLQQAQSAQQHQQRAPPQQQAMPTQIAPRHSLSDPDPSQSLPPEIRRDNRAIPPNPYASQAAPIQAPSPSQPGPISPTQTQHYRGSFPSTRLHSAGDAHHQPRLSTGEVHFHTQFASAATPSSYAPAGAPSAAPAPIPAKPEAQPSQSPNIYFHHWVPPGQAQPSTPSTRGRQESSARPHALSESQTSPGRKRKAIGSHPPPPPPTSQHEHPSPALSTASPGRGTSVQLGHSPVHFRQQSDPSHGFRHTEQHSESDTDSFQRYRPTRESILNPLQSSSRRTSSDAQHGPAHARSEREH